MLIGFVSFAPYPVANDYRDWAKQATKPLRRAFVYPSKRQLEACAACERAIDRDGHCRCI